MKVLITCFEPFGIDTINSSEECVKLLPAEIASVRLPVSYRRAPTIAIEQIEAVRPDVVISLGQAVRATITIERIAINIAKAASADNDGYTPDRTAIVAGAPDGIFSPFNVDVISHRLRSKGYPCQVSNTAGTFVCNALYYHLLRSGVPALFIHLPLTAEQAAMRPTHASSLSPKVTSEALQELITILRTDSIEECNSPLAS